MKKILLTIIILAITLVSYGQEHGNSTSGTQTESYGDSAGIAGDFSNYFGYRAGQYDSGISNSFFGWSTGRNNIGSFNTFIGRSAGHYNQGNSNVFVGHGSGTTNRSGNQNTFLGTSSGNLKFSGNANTFIGFETGLNNISGGGNIFIGFRAGYNETTDNKLYIDNSDTTTPLIYGDFFKDRITFHGQVGIGTRSYNDIVDGEVYALSVAGKVRAESVKVYTGWADYVFEDDYILPTLNEVEDHINAFGHLKDIPSAETVEENGIELGEMNKLLLQKIEELTLYTIEQEKRIKALEAKLNQK